MRVAIVTVQLAYIYGGAEVLANSLNTEMKKRNIDSTIISFPFSAASFDQFLNSMITSRMIDLNYNDSGPIDIIIPLKFPAYYVQHHNKRMWLCHQHKIAYELWNYKGNIMKTYNEPEKIRELVIEHDNLYINECRKKYTIAKTPADRLKKYNNIYADVLYPPPENLDKLHFSEIGDFIFYPSRINPLKRQELLIESAKYLKSNVKIIIAGNGDNDRLKQIVNRYNLQNRVIIKGFISNDEKIELYSKCLAVYFGTQEEDYGYVTPEAFYSGKMCIIHDDAGGPLEFVDNNDTGYVIKPNAELLAEKIDYLYKNKHIAADYGKNALNKIKNMNLNWDEVINNLVN